MVDVVKRNFPTSPSSRRARNRWYAHLLMDRDVDGQVRETFHSSLQAIEMALSRSACRRGGRAGIRVFREHDQQNLRRPTRSIGTKQPDPERP